MSESKAFTEEQDKLIKYLYDDLKIKKWAMVAKRMTEDYGLDRNAKQCRDRYQKFLDPLASAQWTEQQQKRLNYLHSTIGNRWALIASYFPGKTDNYLKNHFYSKLRKALRHLNKIIKSSFRKLFKEIQIGTVYKIIEGFEQQFKEKPHVSKEVSVQCCILKDELIQFACEQEEIEERIENLNFQKERALIERIMQFNKSYKKKSKKQKRQSLQVEQLFKPSKRINLIIDNQKQDEDSQFEKVSSVDSSDQQNDNEMGSEFSSKYGNEDSMKDEKDDIRKSPPIYVIYKEDENDSPSSVKSGGIDIRLSDAKSSNKMQQDQIKNAETFDLGKNEDSKLNFGFMRGESSFRSYGSQSGKSIQSKTQFLRRSENPSRDMHISGKLKETNDDQMEDERDESIFRSHG